MGRVSHLAARGYPGYPSHRDWMGVSPTKTGWHTPLPRLDGGTTPLGLDGGTQEDFLVNKYFQFSFSYAQMRVQIFSDSGLVSCVLFEKWKVQYVPDMGQRQWSLCFSLIKSPKSYIIYYFPSKCEECIRIRPDQYVVTYKCNSWSNWMFLYSWNLWIFHQINFAPDNNKSIHLKMLTVKS